MRLARKIINRQALGRITPACLLTLVAMGSGGCEINSFINPGEPNIVPPNSHTLVKPVLDTLDPSIEDPGNGTFTNATDIQPDDLKSEEGDYRIGKNDQVSVEVYDLMGEGTGAAVRTATVSESGNINLDFIKPVHAEGLTEKELEDAVRDAYKAAGQIKNARVTVTVTVARARTFTIQGTNLGSPNEYQILKSDFRMLDALVLGHGPTTMVDYVYVLRRTKHPTTQPSAAPSDQMNTDPGMSPVGPPPADLLAPPTGTPGTGTPTGTGAPATGPQTRGPGNDNWAALLQTAGEPGGASTLSPASSPTDLVMPPPAAGGATAIPPLTGTTPAPTGVDGPTTRLAPDNEAPAGVLDGHSMPIASSQSNQPAAPGGFGGFKFNAPVNAYDVRVIRVPVRELLNGALQDNIVIRPGDSIIVPDAVTGTYFMAGHVQKPGAYALPPTMITLKMAIAAAGMFDEVAIPGRSEIVRQIGKNKEIYVRIDLDKVWSGEQPDIYLKPNDMVMVGTDTLAPFVSALRNSFRLTYGFGFLYDRNFEVPARFGG